MTAIMTDTVNNVTLYEFSIDTATLKNSSRHNYLVYDIPDSDENIYLYCRREDYIKIRVIDSSDSDNVKDKYYTFIPETIHLIMKYQ